MKKIINILLITTVVILPALSFAQIPVFTLSQILDSVENNYPEILKYNASIEAVLARAEGAKSWMPPSLSAGLDRFPYNPSMIKDRSPMNQAGFMISVEQMIPNTNKLKAKKQYLQSLAKIEEKGASWTKNKLRLYGKYYFYQRLTAEKKLVILDNSKELLELLLRISENRVSYNQSSLSNIFKVKAKIEELKNMRLMEEAMIAESTIGINTLMNRPSRLSFSIDTLISLSAIKNSSFFSDSLFTARSDIAAISGTIASMKLNTDLMRLQRKPDYGIRTTHMQMLGMPEQFSLMGMITLPLAPWSSGMYKSEVKAMEFEVISMEREKETMILMAKHMAEEKINLLLLEHQRLVNLETRILPAYEKVTESSMIAYRQNTGDLFVVLDAWEMLLMKKIEYYDVLFRVLKYKSELEYETETK